MGRGRTPGKDPDKLTRPSRRPEPEELPAAGRRTGVVPALGASYRMRVWSAEDQRHVERTVRFLAETRRWYDVWARSPQATRFTATAWERLRMLGRLVDRFRRGDHELIGEIRLNEAKLGGTPEDLQRLHWKVVDEPTAAATGTDGKAKSVRSRTRRRDPRLQVVK